MFLFFDLVLPTLGKLSFLMAGVRRRQLNARESLERTCVSCATLEGALDTTSHVAFELVHLGTYVCASLLQGRSGNSTVDVQEEAVKFASVWGR